MKKKILLITALLNAGIINCAQADSVQPKTQKTLPIKCFDGDYYVTESTLEKFHFFAGLTDSFGCSLSDLELTPTPTKDYSLICSVKKNHAGEFQFHMNCSITALEILLNIITTPQELLQEQLPILQGKILSLSQKDLASLVIIADQLWLQEPYLTYLEELLIPLFKNPAFIEGFLHDQSIQEVVYACERINSKHLTPCCFIEASMAGIISTENLPTLGNDADTICTVDFNPNGNTTIVTNKKTKTIECIIHPKGVIEKIMSVVCSPNGCIATVTDCETHKIIGTIHHNSGIEPIIFSPDGKYLATGSYDHTAKVTSLETGRILFTIHHTAPVFYVAFSPDGQYFATGSCDRTATVTTITTGETICTINHEKEIICLAFSPDGKYLATGSSDRTAKITNIETGQTIRTINHEGWVYSVALSPDGKYLATGSFDNTIKITEIATKETLCYGSHNEQVQPVNFSPDGKLIAVISHRFGYPAHVTNVINIKSGKIIHTVDIKNYIKSVCFSPDGKYLVTGSNDRTAKITNIRTGETACVVDHKDEIRSVAFTPDGKTLAVNDCCIPFETYDPVQSVLVRGLYNHRNHRFTRLSFTELSSKMRELLFTLSKDLRNDLVCNIPE